jgi:hypothetical protein
MGDHLDVPLEDANLLEEVELISALMIAASEAEGQLDEGEIDRLLGIAPNSGVADPQERSTP